MLRRLRPLPAGPRQHLHPPHGASVDVGHTLEPFGHPAVTLGGSFAPVGAQESVHVVAVLADGVFHAGDVQPADDHPEELAVGGRGRDRKKMGGGKERRVTREGRETERGGRRERQRRRTRKTESEDQGKKGELEQREMQKERERQRMQ